MYVVRRASAGGANCQGLGVLYIKDDFDDWEDRRAVGRGILSSEDPEVSSSILRCRSRGVNSMLPVSHGLRWMRTKGMGQRARRSAPASTPASWTAPCSLRAPAASPCRTPARFPGYGGKYVRIHIYVCIYIYIYMNIYVRTGRDIVTRAVSRGSRVTTLTVLSSYARLMTWYVTFKGSAIAADHQGRGRATPPNNLFLVAVRGNGWAGRR